MDKTILINLDTLDINNYYKNRGVDYIIEKHNIKNDPYINLIIEEESKKILTPLEEWNIKGFINNNKN